VKHDQLVQLQPSELAAQTGGDDVIYQDATAPTKLYVKGASGKLIDNPVSVAASPAVQALVSGAGIGRGNVVSIGNSILYGWANYTILEMVCGLSGGKLTPQANACRGGECTRPNPGTGAIGMTARFDAEVAALRPEIVFALEAVNDQSVGITPAMACADMLEMAEKTKAWGGRFIIIGSPPFNPNPSGISSYNAAYQALAKNNNFEYIHPWADSVNPATGAYKDTSFSADGVHATPKAMRLASLRLWDVLSASVRSATRTNLPQFNVDTQNKVTNGLALNVTSGTPDGFYKVQGTNTSAVTSGTGEVLGNWWTLTKSASSDQTTYELPMSWTGITGGTKLLFMCRLKTTGLEANGVTSNAGQGMANARIQLNYFSGGFTPLSTPIGADVDEAIMYRYFEVPTNYGGGGALQVWIGPNVVATPISGTVSFAQIGLYIVS